MSQDQVSPEPNTDSDEDELEALDWFFRLRQLQRQGHSFDDALAIANSEFPYHD